MQILFVIKDKSCIFAENFFYKRQKPMEAINRRSYMDKIEKYLGKETIIVLRKCHVCAS